MENTCKYKSQCFKLMPDCNCNGKFGSDKCHLMTLRDINDPNTDLMCPRCTSIDVKIEKECTHTNCPFYSEKMAHNCLVIHSNLFFENGRYPDAKIVQISSGLTTRSYNKLLELSIIILRATICIIKYSEYINSERLFNTNEMNKLMKIYKMDNICGICGMPITQGNICSCINNSNLRNDRLYFQKKWKEILLKNKDSFDREVLNKKPVEMMKIYGENIYLLQFIRFLLSNISYNDINFIDIPFGFIFNTYKSLFNEVGWKISRNIGLTDKLYNKAYGLFYLNN